MQISKLREHFFTRVSIDRMSIGYQGVEGYRIIDKFQPFVVFVHHGISAVGRRKWVVSEATTGRSLTRKKKFYLTRLDAIDAAVKFVRSHKGGLKVAVEETLKLSGATPWKENKDRLNL